MAQADVPHWSRAGFRVADRFRLEDRTGELAGASLWKGTDELLRRAVTIYVLPPGLPAAGLPAAVRAGARVTDPRLAKIFDADYGTGSPYIVAEWAPGQHVEDLLVSGPPGAALSAAIVADAADALAIAHDAGRPHLRLGARSLLWGASGVKITGLGIEAGIAGAEADDPAAADTAALARILYALLTGYWPGEATTRLPPAPRHHGRFCTPSQVQAGIPAILSVITSRAMQPGPGDAGLATPAQLARELRSGAPEHAWPAPRGPGAVPRPRQARARSGIRHAAALAGRLAGGRGLALRPATEPER